MKFFPALGLGARLFTGTLHSSPAVYHRPGKNFIVQREEPGVIHTDGETHWTSSRVEVAIQPQCLRIAVPPHSRAAITRVVAPGGFVLRLF